MQSVSVHILQLPGGQFIGYVRHIQRNGSAVLGETLPAWPVTPHRRGALAAALRKASGLRSHDPAP